MEATQKTQLIDSTFSKGLDLWLTQHECKPSEACPWFELDDCDESPNEAYLRFRTEDEGLLAITITIDELQLNVVSKVLDFGSDKEGTPTVWLIGESMEIAIEGLATAYGLTAEFHHKEARSH